MASSSRGSDVRARGAARLGLPAAQSRSEAQLLAESLGALFTETIGPLQDVARDLQALKRFFDPVATGARLRRELAGLPPAPSASLVLAAPLVIEVTPERRLITPEGRVALDLLRHALLRDGDHVLVSTTDVAEAERRLVDVYRSWGRHRLDQVLALQSGAHKPLQMPSIGLLLVLLVDRATDETRSIHLPKDRDQLRRIDRAFIHPAEVFARALLPKGKFNAEKESLYRGWWLKEITRRIPTAISADDERVFIAADGRDRAVALACRELSARPFDVSAVTEAFDALVDTFRASLGVLAGFNLAFERPAETSRLRRELIAGIQQVAGEA